MRVAEFIGIYYGSAIIGIAIYKQEDDLKTGRDKLLMAFSFVGSIWKRSNRKNILSKVFSELEKDAVIVQRGNYIRFKILKILKKDIPIPVIELENKVKYYKEYRRWKYES